MSPEAGNGLCLGGFVLSKLHVSIICCGGWRMGSVKEDLGNALVGIYVREVDARFRCDFHTPCSFSHLQYLLG